MDVIGDYEYNRKEILGHGAFAIVFKGRKKEVSKLFFSNVKRLVKIEPLRSCIPSFFSILLWC